jgi:uncharacterized protein (DUF433 family)
MAQSSYGIGAYSAAEAARLLSVSPQTLRRWLYGYEYNHAGDRVSQAALWNPQYDAETDGALLGFQDLIEAKIVNALRRSGIGLPTIRLCIDRAREMLGKDHPFATTAFKTDGKRIFLEITAEVDEPRLIDLKDRQHVFRSVVLPSLSGLDFGDERVERWWLAPGRRTLVADPRRAFGQPIINDASVLTSRIAQDFKAEGSFERVAKLYHTTIQAVRDAVSFEAGGLRAAA